MLDPIYKLKVHETTAIDNINWTVLRVPGGWVYTYPDFNNYLMDAQGHREPLYTTNHIFVPYSDQAKAERLEDIIK